MLIGGMVMAGGQSRRMGHDKALAVLAGETLAARALRRLRPQVGPIALNANGDLARFAALGVAVMSDVVDGYQGPLAGFATALAWAAGEGCTHVATAAVDCPFIPNDWVSRLAAAAAPGQIALARSDGAVHPVFALIPAAASPSLAAWLQSTPERRLKAWLATQDVIAVDFAPVSIGGATVDPYFNVNTPDDLAVAEGLMFVGRV